MGCDALGERPVLDKETHFDVAIERCLSEVRGSHERVAAIANHRLRMEHTLRATSPSATRSSGRRSFANKGTTSGAIVAPALLGQDRGEP